MSDLVTEILDLKARRNAVILAHYYQRPEIQNIADIIGDSLQLALEAQQTQADVIVLCGVRFMAETAKLMNPDKIVLAPSLDASCSLVEQSPPEQYRAFVDAHPGYAVVSYVNSSLEIKAMSDLVCTSTNAENVIASVPEDRPILFGPDKHLGQWLQQRTGRNIVCWDGYCEVHEAFDLHKIERLKQRYPGAVVLAHPECTGPILNIADVIGSTSALLRYVNDHPEQTFIVATEVGILNQMRNAAPLANLIPAPPRHVTECACSECPHMKINTLDMVRDALRDLQPRIEIEPALMERARKPIVRMLEC